MTSSIQSKADRDRLRQRTAERNALVPKIERVIEQYTQGRAASACMADIIKVLKGQG